MTGLTTASPTPSAAGQTDLEQLYATQCLVPRTWKAEAATATALAH